MKKKILGGICLCLLLFSACEKQPVQQGPESKKTKTVEADTPNPAVSTNRDMKNGTLKFSDEEVYALLQQELEQIKFSKDESEAIFEEIKILAVDRYASLEEIQSVEPDFVLEHFCSEIYQKEPPDSWEFAFVLFDASQSAGFQEKGFSLRRDGVYGRYVLIDKRGDEPKVAYMERMLLQ